MGKYAKAIAAGIGGAITAGFGVIPPHTLVWNLLVVVSAAGTAAGVWAIPNGTRVG